jgi:pyruvate dehydrogenase E1 component alpha subunit
MLNKKFFLLITTRFRKLNISQVKFREFNSEIPISSKPKPKDKISIQKDGKILVEFGVSPYHIHKCSEPKNSSLTSKEELIQFFKDMSLLRRVEVTSDQLYKQRLIRGFLHLYNGQEAITYGMEAAITKEDHVITAYRDHGTFLGRGGTVFEIFSELFGKKTGCSNGKGGSMHFYKADKNFHGGNGIVGAQCPIGTGVAFALKYQNKPNVCVTMYGDGAANQGQLFEAFNMAALWKLPVIYVCENNHYGMGTSDQRAAASITYYTRGDYIPGIKIDAMNVLAVKEGFIYAKDFALKNGPIILELDTYRYSGHSISDPGLSYRTREEVQQIKSEKDPIEKVRYYLTETKLTTEEELKEIEKEIRKVVDEAVKKAQEAPFPDLNETYTDVYAEHSKPYFVRATELANSAVVK